MQHNQIISVLIILFTASAWFGASAKQRDKKLTIYLPREVTVKANTPTLGEIAIIRGDQNLAALASEVSLGYIATPEQDITITRTVVLSRLACNGIPSRYVSLTGADQINIHQERQLITSDQLVQAAILFLEKALHNQSIDRIKPIHTPEDMILPGAKRDVELNCILLNKHQNNRYLVRVTAMNNAKEIGSRDIPFSLKYHHRRVVATRAIVKGEMFSNENVRIEQGTANFPEPSNWTAPYQLIAARSVPVNTVIQQNMVALPQPEVLIKRNQSVLIKIENPGLIASVIGKAMQDGATGELIKVRNANSGIVIMATVNTDGTVKPVY